MVDVWYYRHIFYGLIIYSLSCQINASEVIFRSYSVKRLLSNGVFGLDFRLVLAKLNIFFPHETVDAVINRDGNDIVAIIDYSE